MAWQHHHDERHPPKYSKEDKDGQPYKKHSKSRLYLHIDMDAFFASVEIRDNPSLAGKPVAVGGGSGNKGIITAANYEARKYGLKAGMPSHEARRRCPHGIFLPVNGRKYTYISAQIMEALEEYSPEVRPLSVDEATLEIGHTERLFGRPIVLGSNVKKMVRDRFHLPCSVGIGDNRLVAKMAANLCKPDGLLRLTPEQAKVRFAQLSVNKMVGIGDATQKALNELGIYTLGELGSVPSAKLKGRFGILGPSLGKMARGEWAGRMRKDDEREYIEKSIGHQRTFGQTISDFEGLQHKLVGLVEMVARRVRRAEVVGQVLTLTVRYTDFHTPSHQLKLPCPTDDEETIIEYSWRLLKEIWIPDHAVRLLGISLSSLMPKYEWSMQLELFSAASTKKMESMHNALDDLRDRFGERVISRAMGGRYLLSSSRWSPRGVSQ